MATTTITKPLEIKKKPSPIIVKCDIFLPKILIGK